MNNAYKQILSFLKEKPELYQRSTAPLWDEAHISGEMLKAHLAFDVDAASRKLSFIVCSVNWIARNYLKEGESKLLDLGCGPGLYDELFHMAGFSVTGIDLSKRSIEYAKKSAKAKNLRIEYHYQNYLEINYENIFDVAVLIYCDFGVLTPVDRKNLLLKVKKALRPAGKLILDGFTKNELKSFVPGRTIEYCEGGFWSISPYACIQSNYLYPETENYVEQYLVITEDGCQCYNNWNQVYSAASLGKELANAGFERIELYGDAAGKPLSEESRTICAVAW